MAPEYKIHVKDSAGTLIAILTDYKRLSYRKEVNAPGLAQFELDESHPLVDDLVDKLQIEVWRRDAAAGIAWYADFYGLFRDDERDADALGRSTVVCTAPGVASMLAWRINAYAAGTNNKTLWTSVAGETLMKTLVTNNCTASATIANGRDRNGQITGVSVQADAGGGNTISWEKSRANLLKELQDLARIAGGDFDLIPTGAAAWQFRFYAGQRGTDRSASVLFALEYGNMRRPRLARIRSTERTVAIVGGQGEQSDRAIATRYGSSYASTNDIEMLVDARQGSSTAALNAAGDRALDEALARDALDWQVVQTDACRYGVQYELGDLVNGSYQGVTATKKIRAVSIEVDQSGAETIDIETSDP